jgi:hypothetical protein
MVLCKVCNNEFRAITRTHLAKHLLNFASYLVLYPDADLGRKQRLLISHEEAEALYQEKRLSLSAIARLKGVHPDLIKRDLIYLGYSIRGHDAARYVCDYNAVGYEQLEALAIGIWMGEGGKSGRTVEVTNCDPDLLRIWLKFLLVVCNVDPLKLRLRITLHDLGLKESSEAYWQQNLNMNILCAFHKKKVQPGYEGIPRQPMGTATLRINSKFLMELIKHKAVELTESLM